MTRTRHATKKAAPPGTAFFSTQNIFYVTHHTPRSHAL